MKKILSILIIFSFIIVSIIENASAEDFTLHSGITFGMTMDEVKKIEEKNGYTVNKSTEVYSFYDESGQYKVGETNNTLFIRGSIAGIADSKAIFYFNDEGKLYAMVYAFDDNHMDSECGYDLESFKSIQKLLSEKYKNRLDPDDDPLGYKCPLIIDALVNNLSIYSNLQEFAMQLQSRNRTMKESDVFHCYSSSYIRYDDNSRIYFGHVVAHPDVPGYSQDMNLLFGGEHYLEYHYISNQELKEIKDRIDGKTERENKQQEEKEKEIERQKNNDI